MKNANLTGFKLIKTYPGSPKLGFFEPYTTGLYLQYPEYWMPIYKTNRIYDNTIFLDTDPHKLFTKAFNYTDKGQTIFFTPEDGFFIIVNNERAYFKTEVRGLEVKVIFRDDTFTCYNLNAFPLYFFSESIPS